MLWLAALITASGTDFSIGPTDRRTTRTTVRKKYPWANFSTTLFIRADVSVFGFFRATRHLIADSAVFIIQRWPNLSILRPIWMTKEPNGKRQTIYNSEISSYLIMPKLVLRPKILPSMRIVILPKPQISTAARWDQQSPTPSLLAIRTLPLQHRLHQLASYSRGTAASLSKTSHSTIFLVRTARQWAHRS